MPQKNWIPAGVDRTVPSIARIYDYFLGGTHYLPVDRELAAQMEQAVPDARTNALVNRAFLGRAVSFMIGEGVRQFLDIGSGMPTSANVHQVAQGADPQSRVLYVDKDPTVIAHSELMLEGNEGATMVRADMRDPRLILDHPQTRRLIDFDRPVGLLMLMVWHWVPDDADPWGLIAEYRDALAPGSFLALTHLTADLRESMTDAPGRISTSRSVDQLTERSYDRVLNLFGDFQLVDPGLVSCAQWRPGSSNDNSSATDLGAIIYAGVARKA